MTGYADNAAEPAGLIVAGSSLALNSGVSACVE